MSILKYFIILIFLSTGSIKAQQQCHKFYLPIRSSLNKVDRNGLWQNVKGHYLVEHKNGAYLTNEQSIGISKIIANSLPKEGITDDSLLKIEIRANNIEQLISTPSGKVMKSAALISNQLSIQKDPSSNFIGIIISESLFANLLNKKTILPTNSLNLDFTTQIYSTDVFNPTWAPLWSGDKFYVGGLISISAEPPEAFFAASTKAELQKNGFELANADLANTWIIRAPDAREESFFKFQYPSPERPQDSNRKNKFLIAVGSGPAHNPATRGASEANLIWLGDEQQGVLTEYLKDISQKKINWKIFYRHSGFVQRLSESSFWIGRIDTSNSLTKEGFSSQITDPKIYRQIISNEYDQFLSSLFQDSKMTRSDESYLLATSRGCTQGCSICCSGGLSAFQFFSSKRMIDEIHKIDQISQLSDGSQIDIFFVDSNFNNNANRIIEFSKLYSTTNFKHKFRFFARHNTVNGFLLSEKNGFKQPNLELIRAYKVLGITEIMMGIDAVDNASIMTLKSSRLKLAKTGANTRPTYTYEELQALMNAFEAEHLRTRGFLLTNNPWVSDLDRVDSYYNLLLLWLNNPHFSIDIRNRQVIQLKPFEGSPIGDAAKRSDRKIVKDERFVTEGPFGELDEQFNFLPFNNMRVESNAENVLKAFRDNLWVLRNKANVLLNGKDNNFQTRQNVKLMIQKIIQRDATLLSTLISIQNYPEALKIINDIKVFQNLHKDISPFNEMEQKVLFEKVSSDLYESIRQEYGR
jgi:hypothetical protein